MPVEEEFSGDAALKERLRSWGVERGYRDHRGAWRDAPRSTLRAILEILGGEGDPPAPAVQVVPAGAKPSMGEGTMLVLEDGTILKGAEVPPELPLGYHSLIDEAAGEASRLIVTPGQCYLPGGLCTWGWAAQAYALRTRASWGIGDLGGVRVLAARSAEMGAGMLILGPLHATGSDVPQKRSPYYPGSRCFWNPLYLAVEEVPGFTDLPEREELTVTGRALSADRRIDHNAAYVAKLRALEACWRLPGAHALMEGFRAEHGETLELFATFAALTERYGRGWRSWPESLRRPNTPEVAGFRRAERDRIMFHCWLQALVADQLERASGSLGLVHDLAIGVDPDGADAWIWQDVFASGASIGAPEDGYNPDGQDWGTVAFDPWRLQEVAYEPFVRMVRTGMHSAGGLRFDHVMGLFRLFWIPVGVGPQAGAYVRYPANDLLGILALESHRAAAYVIGEDLGTVEPLVRTEMTERNMLSYKLLWFEETPPEEFPYLSLAAATSHDLPTTKGLWTGSDLSFQKEKGFSFNEEFTAYLRDRLAEMTGCRRAAPVRQVIERSNELVARSGSALATTTLEDVLEVEERHNFPGTNGPWNWSLALPVPVEEALEDERVWNLAETMSRHRPGKVRA